MIRSSKTSIATAMEQGNGWHVLHSSYMHCIGILAYYMWLTTCRNANCTGRSFSFRARESAKSTPLPGSCRLYILHDRDHQSSADLSPHFGICRVFKQMSFDLIAYKIRLRTRSVSSRSIFSIPHYKVTLWNHGSFISTYSRQCNKRYRSSVLVLYLTLVSRS
jgi:hypothetical protein